MIEMHNMLDQNSVWQIAKKKYSGTFQLDWKKELVSLEKI